MKYAAGDIVGLLIFVGVLIFQAVSHFVNTAKEAKKNKPSGGAPQRPAPAQPKPYNPDDDPFDDLLEALGKKPGDRRPPIAAPPAPAKPLPTQSRPMHQPPMTPSPVFVPMPPAQPIMREMPRQQQPAPVVTSAPPLPRLEKNTATIQGDLAKAESKPVFETQIGKEKSLSQRAAENIEKAGGGQSAATVQHRTQTVSQDLTLHELVARLRNPAEIRRAIVMKEIISAPVALR